MTRSPLKPLSSPNGIHLRVATPMPMVAEDTRPRIANNVGAIFRDPDTGVGLNMTKFNLAGTGA